MTTSKKITHRKNPSSPAPRLTGVMYQGPIPPASELAKYEQAVPGAGQAIMRAFERQTKHRTQMEKRTLMATFVSETLGSVLSFLVTLGLVGIGGWLIYKGKQISGLVPLIAVVGLRFWSVKAANKHSNRLDGGE